MNISLDWLTDYIDITLSPAELSHRLTMTGLEIEGMETTAEGDVRLEVNVTPNRPDCLSIFGIAREVAAITGAQARRPAVALAETGPAIDTVASVEIKDSLSCPRYAARVIKGVKVGESPEWLKNRLLAIGQRPVNNVVDATNYLLFEMGHPTHAFDYDRLAGHKIIVRRGGPGERITALDGREHELKDDTLLICDGANTPVALAGVIGGQDSAVSEGTVNVLLESAYFDPAIVRKASKCLGIKTESSYRFERGVDVDNLIYALDRGAQLIAEVAGGAVATGRIDIYPSPLAEVEMGLRPERVNRMLGLDLTADRIAEILRSLSFTVTRANSGPNLFVTPPTFRRDVEAEIDLIEEIARIHGYEQIPVTLHEGAPSRTLTGHGRDIEGTLRTLLTGQGLSEVVNFSFMDPAHLDRFMLPQGHRLRGTVAIRNPLTEEQGVMRTFLIPSLAENLRWNQNRGNRNVRIFELGRAFIATGGDLPDERLHLACLLYGNPHEPHWLRKPVPATFFDIKGVAEELLERLNVTDYAWGKAEHIPYLHPGMAAGLSIRGIEAGYAGALHPDVADAMEVQGPAFVFSIDVAPLVEGITSRRYQSLPRFPAIERDLALLVPDSTTADEALAILRASGGALVEEVSLFDVYRGAPVPEGKKSMAFSLKYRSREKTLSDEEIKGVHAGILARASQALGAELRS